MQPLVTRVSAQTDPGRVRRHNEDAFGFRESQDSHLSKRGSIYVVADGMGGHAAGEIASRLAVETILAAYWRDDAPPGDAIRSAIEAASLRIRLQAEENDEQKGMGTTCVCAVLWRDELYVAHVGDSRAYLWRAGQLRQLTRDHTWVQDQVERELIDTDAASQHPMRNVLTQALGGPSIEIELAQQRVQAGDTILLCSDGLSGVLDATAIAKTLSAHDDPAVTCDDLVRQANEAGGPDNITTLIVSVASESADPGGLPQSLDQTSRFSTSKKASGPLTVVVATGFLILVALLANLAFGSRAGLAPAGTPSPPAPIESTATPASSSPTVVPTPTVPPTPMATSTPGSEAAPGG